MKRNLATIIPRSPAGWLFAVVCVAAACNSISGANDIVLVDGMGEDDNGGDDVANDDSSSGQGGTIDNGSGNGVGPTGSSSQMASSSAATSGAGGAPTTAVASSSASGSDCEYPSGPYGVGFGDIIPPTLSWEGYGPGATQGQSETISMAQFHDCDGSLGINALAVDTSQFG